MKNQEKINILKSSISYYYKELNKFLESGGKLEDKPAKMNIELIGIAQYKIMNCETL